MLDFIVASGLDEFICGNKGLVDALADADNAGEEFIMIWFGAKGIGRDPLADSALEMAGRIEGTDNSPDSSPVNKSWGIGDCTAASEAALPRSAPTASKNPAFVSTMEGESMPSLKPVKAVPVTCVE